MNKVLIFAILATITSQLTGQKSKNDDEGRPYEFGFTIDGEQHRHEKKDERGIIQGEFGFITADGIYHVTAYATDENGNFKILSMRNVRISAPLDGSPGPGPSADAKGIQGSQAPSAQPLPLQVPEAKPPSQPISQTPQPITSAPGRTQAPFTTQPTIKPACGGCGYVTTQKPQPGQPFPFQTPQFQNQGGNGQNQVNSNGQSQVNGNVQNTQYSSTGGNTFNTQYPSTGGNTLNTQYPATGGNNYNTQYLSNNVQNTGPNQVSSVTQTPQISQPISGVPQGPPTSVSQYNQQNNIADNPLPLGLNQNSPAHNTPQNNGQVSTLPPISVSNGVIQVQGNNPQTIPIQDKFPGMSDGLPNGINEKDITDLLYKFSYTVGFHGHYEKGLKNGAKIGGYFVNGRDGVSRVVTYVADENGYRPKFKFIRLGLESDETPKEATEKTFGLKSFEFVWYPIE